MSSALTATCPACQAEVTDDDATCARCGATVSAWRAAQRTPLILPGNPALSDDMFRGRTSPIRMIAASLVGAAAVLGVLYLTSIDDSEEPAIPVALLTADTPLSSDSAAGMQQSAPERRASVDSGTLAAAAQPTDLPPTAAPWEPSTAAPLPAQPVPAQPVPTVAPTVAPAIAATTPATPATPARPVQPVLRLAPLVSDSLRPGELVQLRGNVQDRTSGRALPTAIEYTSTNSSVASVDRRTGMVTGRAPGRVRIIADGAAAGRMALDLIVRAPTRIAVTQAAPETLQMRSEAARSVSVIDAPSRAPAPIASAPVVSRPVTASPLPAAPAPASPAPATRDDGRASALNTDDVRVAVNRFVAQVRNGGVTDPALLQFLADGAGHRAALVSAPATISASASIVRVTFELRLTKFDGGGRPVTRIAPVSLDVEKRQNDVSVTAVTVNTLRKP